MRASRREVVDVSGAVIELAMPYAGGLSGIPAGVRWEVRGSTINLDRPVNARLILRYETWWERVFLTVPTVFEGKMEDPIRRAAAEYAPGDLYGVAAAGYPSARKNERPELPEAGIVAFWGRLAASCELMRPNAQDESIHSGEIDLACNPQGSGSSDWQGEPCYRNVHHYVLCNCSLRRIDTHTSQEEIDCPQTPWIPAGFWDRDEFDDYVKCDGEEDEVHEREYYEKHCCKGPPGLLPRCRRLFETFAGGAEIENGPDHWKNIYGADVAMVAVMPAEGRCGTKTVMWHVPNKNCCDEVPPLVPHPENPTSIHVASMTISSIRLRVLGGDFDHKKRWTVSGGYYFSDGDGNRTQIIEDGGNEQVIYADPDLACDNGAVNVEDGCSRISMKFVRENPAEAMTLLPDHAVVGPGGYVTFQASGNQGHVQWAAQQLRLVSPQGGKIAMFEVPEHFCGVDRVIATDACLRIAQAVVVSTVGRWVEVFDFDPCAAPWGGAAPSDNETYVDNYMGWRARLASITSGSVAFYPVEDHGGSCDEAWKRRPRGYYDPPEDPCGYTGEELVVQANGEPYVIPGYGNCFEPGSTRTCIGHFCWNNWDGRNNNQWAAKVQWITQLWRWECGE